jgi:hypothetical protein
MIEEKAMPSRLPCALAALLFFTSGSALAQVAASGAYNSLSYELVDRDPNDGITPWATFDLTEVYGTAVAYDAKEITLGECTLTSLGSCTVETPNGAGTVWFDGNSSGARATWSEDASGIVHVDTRAVFSYSISPRTDFWFILDTSVHKKPPEGVDATGGLFFFFNSDEGWFRAIEQYEVGDRIDRLFVQTGEEPVRGEVRAYVDMAAGHYVPPPVPEAPTWALWSGGLFLFLAAAARNFKRAPSPTV